MNWSQVREIAMTFEPVLREKWPQYLEEMKGTDQIFMNIVQSVDTPQELRMGPELSSQISSPATSAQK